MPVQPGHLQRCIIFRREFISARLNNHPSDHNHTGDHVKTVQTGHDEVNGEKYVRIIPLHADKGIIFPRQLRQGQYDGYR